ncbi:hypothetical protein [Streptomyces sp. DG1A-41]|uniref:hypothetical protein n=1 Tax=Streptomyces sp. DG1A-41 TaxID=3125779 RepID=UPI0030CFF681
MADPQAAQPTLRLEDRLVDDPKGRPGYPGFLGGLPLTGVVQGPAGDLGESQMRPQHPHCGPPPFAAPERGLDPVPQRGENLVRMLARLHSPRAGTASEALAHTRRM